MKNVINKLSFYKGTSVMLIEVSIGVVYGEATPFAQFKFAPRADAQAQGQWDDLNCFWITSYVELYNFVNGMNMVTSGKLEKYEMKNPKKGVMVQIRASNNAEKNIDYVTFHFFRGQDVKIKTSLVKSSEYLALFGYFKNLLETYNTVCAIALLRNDIYYEYFVKGKEKAGSDQNTKQNQTKKEGGDKKSSYNKPPTPKEYQSNLDNDMSDIGENSSSSGIDFGDDVPF